MTQFYPVRLFNEHAYAMIDYVAIAQIPKEWPLVPLVPQGFEDEAYLLPALLPLKEFTDGQRLDALEMLDQTHERGEALPIVTFLNSDADLEQMRRHCIRQLILSLPNRRKTLLRSYDPSVFAQLLWMFTPGQLLTLFGPICRWTTYLNHRWQSARPPVHDGLPCGHVDLHQAEQLARIGMINRVLFQLAEEQRLMHEAVSRSIDMLLVRALDYGLTREKELVEFALNGMTVHPQFDHHPVIAQLLSTLDPAEQTYCDAVALLDAAAWKHIAYELGVAHSAPSMTGLTT